MKSLIPTVDFLTPSSPPTIPQCYYPSYAYNRYNIRALQSCVLSAYTRYIWQNFVTSEFFHRRGNGTFRQILSSSRCMWHKSKEPLLFVCLSSRCLLFRSPSLCIPDRQTDKHPGEASKQRKSDLNGQVKIWQVHAHKQILAKNLRIVYLVPCTVDNYWHTCQTHKSWERCLKHHKRQTAMFCHAERVARCHITTAYLWQNTNWPTLAAPHNFSARPCTLAIPKTFFFFLYLKAIKVITTRVCSWSAQNLNTASWIFRSFENQWNKVKG